MEWDKVLYFYSTMDPINTVSVINKTWQNKEEKQNSCVFYFLANGNHSFQSREDQGLFFVGFILFVCLFVSLICFIFHYVWCYGRKLTIGRIHVLYV